MSLSTKYPRLQEELQKYKNPEKKLKYGTAGFRDKAEILESTFYRMGMLALLRSRKTEQTIGVMVTASHNPEPDNGIKMVDPDGGMLEESWEQYAMDLANAAPADVPGELDKIVTKEDIGLDKFGSIFIGMDTRPSSEKLSVLVREGALLIGGNVLDFGLQTTPQLHHIVRMFNKQLSNWASEAGYYDMLTEGYKNILAGVDPKKEERGKMIVDGAHGVGAEKFPKFQEKLSKELDIEIRNTTSDGTLNDGCGAELVQKGRKPPHNFDKEKDKLIRIVSFDGDADRVVYSYFDDKGNWKLLDGDKIAALCAMFLKKNLKVLGLDKEFKMAAVQTAYANGNSGKYIQSLDVEVPLAKTGVKFVHHKAMEYDIGSYFEANGHGTIVFKEHVIAKLKELETKETDAEKKLAVTRLLASVQLINQAVGDAMSDALFVEAVLTIEGMSIQDWDNLYVDLPSRQTKLAVEDRAMVEVNENETKVIKPQELQDAIDEACKKYESGRGFVRPSGTEDVVRVYAEADSQDNADKLALEIAQAAHTHAKGIGEKPTEFKA